MRETRTLFSRYFEGVFRLNSGITFSVEPVIERNRMYIILDGATADEMRRTTALKVEVSSPGIEK